MDLHPLLKRQMNRLAITLDQPPANAQQWQDFIARINNTYREADEERYLLERPTEISTKEILELNTKLENASRIAKFGYWFYDPTTRAITGSKEVLALLGFNTTGPPPSYDEIRQLVHKNDKHELDEKVADSIKNGVESEMEVRMKRVGGEYCWYHVICHPQLLENHHGFVISGTFMDINKRKKAEQKIRKLQQKLVDSARQAGMAEVAASVLHNVGNVLNSVCVSSSLLREYLEKPHFKKLFMTVRLMEENLSSLATYLTEDPRGQLVPKFLISLCNVMKEDYNLIVTELDGLNEHLIHIKEIVAAQQTLTGVSGVMEKLLLSNLVDSALMMSDQSFIDNEIKIEKRYFFSSYLITDKSKVLQILVNLIKNSAESLTMLTTSQEKLITIETQEETMTNQVKIKIIDNGVGILKSHLINIFSFGFTTKPNGHGFGLHTCALAAKELGGSLTAESNGLNQGAIFTLTLPL